MSSLPRTLTVKVLPHERLVRMSIEVMDTLCTRDNQGNRLRVEWREAEDDGTYTPIIHIDSTDNPLRKRLEEAESKLAGPHCRCWECGRIIPAAPKEG